MPKITSRNATIIVITATLLINSIWYVLSPSVTEAQKNDDSGEITSNNVTIPKREGKYVLIHLDSNILLLKDGDNIVASINLVSQGKPGSYYETMGGLFKSDYKEQTHFSTIGHVYMPYSVHIFGNYFIHGIPYYPSGEKVSSTYSGGCIRLNDVDAEKVYNFITPQTPIIITKSEENDFYPSSTSTKTITSMNMTRLMVASISLEFLTQDNEILGTDGYTTTTRRSLLPDLLLNKDANVSSLYARSGGEELFVAYMNNKAMSLGLTNTSFSSVNSPAITTEEDYARFMSYIITYKSYLQKILESTSTTSSSL